MTPSRLSFAQDDTLISYGITVLRLLKTGSEASQGAIMPNNCKSHVGVSASRMAVSIRSYRTNLEGLETAFWTSNQALIMLHLDIDDDYLLELP